MLAKFRLWPDIQLRPLELELIGSRLDWMPYRLKKTQVIVGLFVKLFVHCCPVSMVQCGKPISFYK